MAKDPAFLFYSSDFLTGTMLMNFEDKGKYITILAAMHQQGRMSEENIRFLIGTVSDNLKAKFEIDDSGKWFNSRLEEEIRKRIDFVESRRINGSKGGRPKKPLGKPNGKPKEEPKDNLPEDDNENVIIDINVSFLDFWNLYDKKNDKAKCERKWNNLKDQDRLDIMNYIPAYVESTPDKEFRKDPATFLNNRSWENEIIERSVTDKKGYDASQFDKLDEAIKNGELL